MNPGQILNSHTVQYQRLLPGPIERVWSYISDAQRISQWQRCAADVDLELKVGGRFSEKICQVPPSGPIPADLQMVPIPKGGLIEHPRGLVTECIAPTVLAYSFMDPVCNLASEVRFQLEKSEGQVLLTFTHSHLPPDMMAQVGAGWHVHLDTLAAILRGEEVEEFLPAFVEQFKRYSAAVAATLVVASAGTPAIADANDAAYQIISQQRAQLLAAHDRAWKDADDLKYKISVLAKERSEDVGRAQNDLQNELNRKYDDLHQIELDIRDLDKALIH